MTVYYYVAETDANAGVGNRAMWQPTKAKTLNGAKGAAQRARAFQGTAAHVAVRNEDGDFVTVATRYPAGHVWAGWVETWAE